MNIYKTVFVPLLCKLTAFIAAYIALRINHHAKITKPRTGALNKLGLCCCCKITVKKNVEWGKINIMKIISETPGHADSVVIIGYFSSCGNKIVRKSLLSQLRHPGFCTYTVSKVICVSCSWAGTHTHTRVPGLNVPHTRHGNAKPKRKSRNKWTVERVESPVHSYSHNKSASFVCFAFFW